MLHDFLIAVGVMCALNGILALIMVIADATIANYGTVRININGRKDLDVQGGRPLLTTLKDEKLFIPSACGGRGSCGLCKCKVLEGAGEPLQTELPWLNAEERASHVRLSCQVKVKKPLRIELPEALFSIQQFQTTVSSIRNLTHDIKEVRLKLNDPDTITFRAGQFVQFEVPPYERSSEGVYRAYSVSSDPALTHEIELEVRYVPNGICTTYVHQFLKVGDPVTLNGPHGEFFLRESDRDIICIAGGSGMAPIKAILLDIANRKVGRKIRYFFGARSRRDLFLLDEMRELEQRLPDFKFIPALSEPTPEDQWTGETGLITQVVERLTPSAANAEAYLCGSPFMIDACIKTLKGRGIPDNMIFYDKFS